MKFCLLVLGHLVSVVVCTVESVCPTVKDKEGPKTSEELQEAIDKATDGLIIELLPIEYKGDFVLKTKSPEAKVTLKGNEGCDKRSTIVGSLAALSVKQGIWTISNVDIEGGAVGVILKGPNNILEMIEMKNVENGFTINGNGNTVRNCTVAASYNGIIIKASDSYIEDVKLEGTGIQIKSGDSNTLKTVRITGIPEGSTGVVINEKSDYNILDSFSVDGGVVKVKGDSNTLFNWNGLATFIVEGDFNNLHDMTVGDSVKVKGNSNTLHSLNVKDSVVISGQNNTLNDLSIQGSLSWVCGNTIGKYTSGSDSSPSCN